LTGEPNNRPCQRLRRCRRHRRPPSRLRATRRAVAEAQIVALVCCWTARGRMPRNASSVR
jgi:hypothetical protein